LGGDLFSGFHYPAIGYGNQTQQPAQAVRRGDLGVFQAKPACLEFFE
jgi:hypothetical protein